MAGIELSGINSKSLLSRAEPIYMEIEKCKTSYELRYAIAYEAAIRNQTIKEALYSCIKEKNVEDCNKLKSLYGFTDEAILYYRITHRDIFPINRLGNKTSGLSKLEETHTLTSPYPYRLTPLCSEHDTIVLNNTPLIQTDDGISIADISNYSDFKELAFSLRFCRPMLRPLKSKTFYVELNFELPATELVEYIDLLHRIYKRNNPATALEMIDDEIQLSQEEQKRAVSLKYADMLYVYDYVNSYRENFPSDIKMHEKIAIDLAHSVKKTDRDVPSTNTIRNYRQTMEKLVDEYGYLTFLTAVSH